MAIRINAIPLLGKTLTPHIKNELSIHGVKDVVVALDSDASKHTLNLVETLCNVGIRTKTVKLIDKDPGDSGYVQMTHLIENSILVDFNELLEMKLNEHNV
jgi:hypothetical protein